MKLHRMKLQSSPFEMMKQGDKRIECRLHDRKRQQIEVGDEVIFTNIESDEELRVRVLELLPYSTFGELFDSHSPSEFGTTNGEHLDGIYRYYSREDEKKYGALGIRVEMV